MLLMQIRADPALKQIPVIVSTAQSMQSTLLAAKDAGANGYIVKPFTKETLERSIREIFDSGVAWQ